MRLQLVLDVYQLYSPTHKTTITACREYNNTSCPRTNK